jgi:hypothetical protein
MSSNSLNGKSVLSSFPGWSVAGIAAIGASRAGGLCNGPFAQYIVFINSLPQSLRSPGFGFPSLRIWIFLPLDFGIVSSRTLAAILR